MDKIQTGTSAIREFANFIVNLPKIPNSKGTIRAGAISSSVVLFCSTAADKTALKFDTTPLAISMISFASSTEKPEMVYNVRKQMVRV